MTKEILEACLDLAIERTIPVIVILKHGGDPRRAKDKPDAYTVYRWDEEQGKFREEFHSSHKVLEYWQKFMAYQRTECEVLMKYLTFDEAIDTISPESIVQITDLVNMIVIDGTGHLPKPCLYDGTCVICYPCGHTACMQAYSL